MRPVVVGGVGRSGTTVLKSCLVAHPRVLPLGGELRFLSDPDALLDLADALLTGRWSPHRTGLAVARFERFHLKEQGNKIRSLFGDKGAALVHAWLRDEVVHHRSTSSHHPDADGTPETRPMPEHEVRAKLRAVVEGLMERRAAQAGKEFDVWVDDTPETVCDGGRVLRWWPEATVVHAVRDPLQNALAIWARSRAYLPRAPTYWPDTVMACVRRVEAVLRSALPLRGRRGYVVVRLEDLVRNPKRELTRVCRAAGLAPALGLADRVDGRRVTRYDPQDQFTAAELQEARRILAPMRAAYGYGS